MFFDFLDFENLPNPLIQDYDLKACYTPRGIQSKFFNESISNRIMTQQSHHNDLKDLSLQFSPRKSYSKQTHPGEPQLTDRQSSVRPITPSEVKNKFKVEFRHSNFLRSFQSTKKQIEKIRVKKFNYQESVFAQTQRESEKLSALL